jgi:hypothetical protein
MKFNWIYELPFGNGRQLPRILERLGRSPGRRLGIRRHRAHPERQHGRLRQRAPGRHEHGRSAKAYKIYEYARTGSQLRALANIYLLPQDILENTVKAFSTSATSTTGYGSLGAPTGRYLAPANGPDCIETTNGTPSATRRAPGSAARARSRSPVRCTRAGTSAR